MSEDDTAKVITSDSTLSFLEIKNVKPPKKKWRCAYLLFAEPLTRQFGTDLQAADGHWAACLRCTRTYQGLRNNIAWIENSSAL